MDKFGKHKKIVNKVVDSSLVLLTTLSFEASSFAINTRIESSNINNKILGSSTTRSEYFYDLKTGKMYKSLRYIDGVWYY